MSVIKQKALPVTEGLGVLQALRLFAGTTSQPIPGDCGKESEVVAGLSS
jgi:hypothetical protein